MKFFNPRTTVLLASLAQTGCLSLHQTRRPPDKVPYFNPQQADMMPEFPPIMGKSENPPDSAGPGATMFHPAEHAHRPRVQTWLQYFSTRGKESLQKYLSRGAPYRPFIEESLRREHMPLFLYFVPVIESGFNLKARSHASAMGPWQFMSGTAKRFGLRVNSFVDERRDIYRATEAACLYLKRLHKVFHSWPLALAAYNAGESRVMNAILKTGLRDFWSLARKNALPRETLNYVPKLIAAYILANEQEYLPLTDTSFKKPSSVEVPPGISLQKVATTLNLSHNTLKKYNNHLKRGITPPDQRPYRLWVPASFSVPPDLLTLLKKIKPVTKSSGYHQVSAGESLYKIAGKYGTSVAEIKKINGLRGSSIYPGQKLTVPRPPLIRYKVRKGDNLIRLAKKFGMSVSKLKQLNSISRSMIYEGQVLLIDSSQI